MKGKTNNIDQSIEYGIAVDLGSTSIALEIWDMNQMLLVASKAFSNPQHIHGADVISRIRYCQEDCSHLSELSQLVKDAIWTELVDLFRENNVGDMIDCIERMVISGNTTMLHIIRELSVNGLAVAPFKPVSIDSAVETAWFSSETEVIYLPGISAFVGADILAGAKCLNLGQDLQYDLLVDLGTNGEILLVNKNGGFATSTACGPVFDHVISGAKYGSESLKAVANCVKRKLIQTDGTIVEPFFDKGIEIDKNFVIKQQHVRNLQLAKGAIYAGIVCLLKKALINYDEIKRVYISGGLGFYMDIKDAFIIKMLPEELKEKITICENTSLLGARLVLLHESTNDNIYEDVLREYEGWAKHIEGIELADLEMFQDVYMSSLEF